MSGCGCSSTTPTGCRWRSASGSPATCDFLLTEYGLEVSSPGPERPLTKPEHFRRFLGRNVRVRTKEAIGGRRSFTGKLTGADEQEVSVETPDDGVTIELANVHRSNLVPDESEVAT